MQNNNLHRFNWVRENLFEPNSKQITPLVCPNPKKITNFQRREGTSKLLSAMALYECLTKPKRNVYFISPNKGMNDLHFVTTNDLIPGSPLLKISNASSNNDLRFIEFLDTRSKIRFCHKDIEFNFHGSDPHLILVDGCKYHPEKESLLTEITVSRLSAYHGDIEVIICNPDEAYEGWNVYY